jgi:hypothetical protein
MSLHKRADEAIEAIVDCLDGGDKKKNTRQLGDALWKTNKI